MHGFENNYNVMEWYLNNWNGQITPAQSKKDAGRYYTNHFAIAVSLSIKLCTCMLCVCACIWRLNNH